MKTTELTFDSVAKLAESLGCRLEGMCDYFHLYAKTDFSGDLFDGDDERIYSCYFLEDIVEYLNDHAETLKLDFKE
jgi:hypothetical protein